MNIAIILAAGHGWRLGAGNKKAFTEVLDRPLLYFSLNTFLNCKDVDKVVVVTPPGTTREFGQVLDMFGNPEVLRVTGGETRFKSLRKAISALEKNKVRAENILIHNAANPMVTLGEIEQVLTALEKNEAAGVAVPLADTLRKIKRMHTETIPRENTWRMQTPQGLHYDVLKKGIEFITSAATGQRLKKTNLPERHNSHDPTDDLQLAEIQGIKPKIIPGTSQNFKITTSEDMMLLEDVLASRREFQAGLGEDSHRFSKKGKLTLGGLKFDKFPKLEANSDGDVMLHALTTALLQTLGLGSLGPFADPMIAQGSKSSKKILARALELMSDEGWHISSLQFMTEGSRPKFDKIARKIRKSVADLCEIDIERISIAAHSGEELTPFGKGEGLRCQCLVSLERLWLG